MMVIKVYVAVISCSQEVKKNQQRALMILESKNIPYSAVDITDPSFEDAKDYMVETAVPKPNNKVPFTPQIFNDADYCGDFEGLDMANECDTLGDFLKLSEDEKGSIKIGITGIPGPNYTTESSTTSKEEETKISNGVGESQEQAPSDVIEPEPVAEEIAESEPLEEGLQDSSEETGQTELEPEASEENHPTEEVKEDTEDINARIQEPQETPSTPTPEKEPVVTEDISSSEAEEDSDE